MSTCPLYPLPPPHAVKVTVPIREIIMSLQCCFMLHSFDVGEIVLGSRCGTYWRLGSSDPLGPPSDLLVIK